MTIFFAVLLTIGTFALVMYPFFRKQAMPSTVVKDEALQELSSRRDTTYSMLKELEFDFQTGLLTEEDYRDLETRYKDKAVSILKGMDTSTKGTKRRKGTGVEEVIEKQVSELRRGKGQFCPQCGERYQKGDRFCSRCGARLEKSKGRRSD